MACVEYIFIPPKPFSTLNLKVSDVVILSSTKEENASRPFTRCIGRVVPMDMAASFQQHFLDDSSNNYYNMNEALSVHPILYDFLREAEGNNTSGIVAQFADQSMNNNKAQSSDNNSTNKSIEPVTFCLAPTSNPIEIDESPAFLSSSSSPCPIWKIQTPDEVVEINDVSVHVTLRCLYTEIHVNHVDTALQSYLSSQLSDRCIAPKSIAVISEEDSCVIVEIASIVYDNNLCVNPKTVFRMPSSPFISVTLSMVPEVIKEVQAVDNSLIRYERGQQCTTTPGYEDLEKHCYDLLCIQGPSRPTALLLTGCPGVGKSRLAKSVAYQMEQNMLGETPHVILLQDFLLQAMGQTATELARALFPPRNTPPPALVVIEDVHILANATSDQGRNDAEIRALLAALINVVDECVRANIPVLGIAIDALTLPPGLVKAGRFEKELHMEAPTFRQREAILQTLLHEICHVKDSGAWAGALASTTAGCVAADLKRICIQAQTSAWARTQEEINTIPTWSDFREAAHTIVPSQLALLDVVKPLTYKADGDSANTDDWETIHYKSWALLSGYADVKKRIYRTVVLPWRRVYLSKTPVEDGLSGSIIPPSGVLFHGATGCGKSVAAGCLASSLGLPMIQVRAADVLDKWLGGSEAIIRSLFARARSAAPCVLFFDEIDAIATNRSKDSDTVDVMSRVLSTLLNEMDGVSTNKMSPQVLVVACTNRQDSLDAALLRPGRLDEHVELNPLSEVDDIEAVLVQHLSCAPLDSSLDLRRLAGALLQGRPRSGAELEGLCREAVLRAMRRTQQEQSICVTLEDMITL